MHVPRFVYLFFNLFLTPLGQIAYEAGDFPDFHAKSYRKLPRSVRKEYQSMALAAIRAKKEGNNPTNAMYDDLWQGKNLAFSRCVKLNYEKMANSVLEEAEKRNLL